MTKDEFIMGLEMFQDLLGVREEMLSEEERQNLWGGGKEFILNIDAVYEKVKHVHMDDYTPAISKISVAWTHETDIAEEVLKFKDGEKDSPFRGMVIQSQKLN